jgi:alkylation response protein AidB-like acyl-CoA dehydrogenase
VTRTLDSDEIEETIVATVRQFIDRDVKPNVRELEHANEYPSAWIETMKELGVFGLNIPEEFGGSDVSMPCFVRVTAELARGWMSLAGAVGGHSVVASLIDRFGTPAQRERFLPLMATGQIRAAMALTEASGGSDLQALRTRAVRRGDEYVVDGS